VEDPQPKNWKEIIPHRDNMLLEGVDIFSFRAVIRERENGLPVLRIRDLQTEKDRPVSFSEPVFSISPENNRHFQTHLFRFRYQSLVTPESVFEMDMGTGERKLLKQTEVLGGYDP